MDGIARSLDGTKIHYEISGRGRTALLFVHGWLGSTRWWDAQRDFFSDRYLVVQVDLAGHGQSERSRTQWSAQTYAEDIGAVGNQIDADRIVLIGHSMAGAYAVEAGPLIPKTAAIVLVDTLKNLDQLTSLQQTGQLFDLYRKDFKSAVENVLSQYLFAKSSPVQVRSRILREFLSAEPEFAIQVIEPLYRMDVRESAKRIKVPVRAINSDFSATHCENNRKCFQDYGFEEISGTGHYPMLESPEAFNRALTKILGSLNV